MKNGWWEQPASLKGDPVWKAHKFQFAQRGGAQMFAYDVDGDGDNDLITSLNAHGWGLSWFENRKNDAYCTSGDCRAVLRNNDAYCKSGDCKALIRKNDAYCTTGDCKAYIRNNDAYCKSSSCKAILRKNDAYCK